MLAPSSPRLPSPPPPVEIQIGPKSPSGGASPSPEPTVMEQSLIDANSRRRIHPGTKAADMAAGPPLVPLNELDSAFQLQEHLAALHWHHTEAGSKPLTRETALEIAKPPPGVDRSIWLYELCRFLISECNSLIVGFLFDQPPCSAFTCPEMRASEWQFLCAVHEQPKSCCAIDYCCHTLDWAANVVTDQKIFPSRFSVLSDPKSAGLKSLVNVFRRLHRMFAHAWFQHRTVFWSIETQTGLYIFFKAVCDLFEVLPPENYRLPPEAEGLEAAPEEPEKPTPTILKTSAAQRGPPEEDPHPPSRTNTRRHVRSSPSTGSAVTTVMEADEEDGSQVAKKMQELHISAPATVEEEEQESAEVPVMVEPSVVMQHDPVAAQDASHEDTDPDETITEINVGEVDSEEDEPPTAELRPSPGSENPEGEDPSDTSQDTIAEGQEPDDQALPAQDQSKESSATAETDEKEQQQADLAEKKDEDSVDDTGEASTDSQKESAVPSEQ